MVVESIITGEILATGVTEDEYMERYAAHFCEFVGGTVVKMSPVHDRHDKITQYLVVLFNAYLALRPIGRLQLAPFAMRLSDQGIVREPDIQLILHTNPHPLTPTVMDGPADLCVEIVSPESVGRDHGSKLAEYEKGGVGEYWIVDPLRDEARFYRRDESGVYIPRCPGADGRYTTPALPGLRLHVPTLWQSPPPDLYAIAGAVKTMLE